MNISFSPRAETDLESIHRYIAEDSEEKASEVIARILQSIRTLGAFPLIGRPGRVEDTREWPVTGLPYIAIYWIKSETELEILVVKHERQRYP